MRAELSCMLSAAWPCPCPCPRAQVCLFDRGEVSLRDMMRQAGGASDEELQTMVHMALQKKTFALGGHGDMCACPWLRARARVGGAQPRGGARRAPCLGDGLWVLETCFARGTLRLLDGRRPAAVPRRPQPAGSLSPAVTAADCMPETLLFWVVGGAPFFLRVSGWASTRRTRTPPPQTAP